MRSFCPQHGQAEMVNNINETKMVWLDIDNQTKTSLCVSVYNGETRFRCSYIPDDCEKLKFHEQSSYNMWTNCSYVSHYFKMIKSQKWPEFKHYLSKLLDSLHLNVDGVLTVNVELPYDIQQKLGAPEYC